MYGITQETDLMEALLTSTDIPVDVLTAWYEAEIGLRRYMPESDIEALTGQQCIQKLQEYEEATRAREKADLERVMAEIACEARQEGLKAQRWWIQ